MVAAEVALDVALIDVRFRDGTGMDVLSAWRTLPTFPAALMLTTFPDNAALLACLQLGARGFLHKDIGLEELLRTIRFVHEGGRLARPALLPLIRPQVPDPAQHFALTEREVEALRLLGTGLNNRELAQVLCVTEGTIKNRVSSILQKMGVRDRTAAVVKGIECGLI